MLKNILKIVLNIFILLLLFLLQIYVFNNIYIFGARFNLIAIFCVIFAMLTKLKTSLIITLIVGLLTDIILVNGKLEYMLIFMIMAIVIESLKLVYKQDSPYSVAIYSTAGLITLEVIAAIFGMIQNDMDINIFSLMFFVLKTLVLNIPLCYILYGITLKVNEKLER